MIQLKLVFIFFTMSTTIYCQNTLKIRVIDQFSKPISNCHIENLMTKEIVLSDDKGYFKIKTGRKDVLKFSHIQYKSKLIRTWKIKDSIFDLVLKPETFLLPQVNITNKFTGNLYVDTSKVTKGSNVSSYNLAYTLKKTKKVMNIKPTQGETHLIKPKSLVAQGSVSIEYNIEKSKEYLKRKSLIYKSKLANNILNELGKEFFYRDLKIPADKYYLFIQYCNPLGIEGMHKRGEIFSLIKLFTTESKTYLKLKEK